MTQHFFPSVRIFYSVEHLRLTKQTLIVFLQNMSHLNNIWSAGTSYKPLYGHKFEVAQMFCYVTLFTHKRRSWRRDTAHSIDCMRGRLKLIFSLFGLLQFVHSLEGLPSEKFASEWVNSLTLTVLFLPTNSSGFPPSFALICTPSPIAIYPPDTPSLSLQWFSTAVGWLARGQAHYPIR